LNLHDFFLYSPFVLVAGFIDSIAGGGGLITIPVLSLILGPGPAVVGTNKIIGGAAAAVALYIYARKGHLEVRRAAPFLLGIFAGTLAGSQCAVYLPGSFFKWIVITVAPFLLLLVWRKDALVNSATALDENHRTHGWKLAGLGFACGFYDGIFGPGGGTFMFLSLALVAGWPVLTALATSKLANSISAFASLANFSRQGLVRWQVGLPLALVIFLGAFAGSHMASRQAGKIVKPVLTLVVILLIIQLFFR
jgi:uncharacterized membrane protein YfcA